PVTSYNERKKLTEQAIIDFYRNHEVKLSDYLEAAWRYRHRGEADRSVTLADWATRRRLSGKYLALVTTTLDEAKNGPAYLKEMGVKWEALPAPASEKGVPPELKELEQFIAQIQTWAFPQEPALINSNAGNWPIGHLAMRAKVAAARDKFDPAAFK